MQHPEEQREAVLAIQGGGVYGLTLVGQLQAVLENGYRVLALAGTSAGAIVATLAWAGFSPQDMREVFLRLARSRDGTALGALLGPFDPADFDPEALKALWASGIDLLGSLQSVG